jgi:hypothetical protein
MRERTLGTIAFALLLAGPARAAAPPELGIGSYEKVRSASGRSCPS